MTHELWTTLNHKMVEYLDSVSLQDLVDKQRMRQLEASKGQSAVRVGSVAGAKIASSLPA